MKKKLSKEFKEGLDKIKIPDGQVGIPFLTPTVKDNFIEELIDGTKYKITFEKSSIVVDLKGEGKFEIHEMNCETDYYQAKMFGYLMCRTQYLAAKI